MTNDDSAETNPENQPEGETNTLQAFAEIIAEVEVTQVTGTVWRRKRRI